MTVRFMGAVLILSGCGWFGFSMAAAHRKTESQLFQLIRCAEFMQWELEYRQTPLPELCRKTAGILSGAIRDIFLRLAALLEELNGQTPGECMEQAAGQCLCSGPVKDILLEFGASLGQFHLQAQLSGLQTMKGNCERMTRELARNRDSRLRSYQTLGLCTGAALAILLL